MKPFRAAKVASEIRQIVSVTVRDDLQDPRISAMVSVTRVEVSPDLEHAKVYFSVFGEDAAQQLTMVALQHAVGFVQNKVARGLAIRQCPHLVFLLDDSLKVSSEVSALLREAAEEDHGHGDDETDA